MNDVLVRCAAWFGAITTAIVFVALISVGVDPWSLAMAWKTLSASTTITAALLILFERKAWVMGVWQGWLVNIPVLKGEWQGEIRSTWEDEEGKRLPAIPVTIMFSQTLCHLSMSMVTPESRSDSLNARVDYDSRSNQVRVSGIFLNAPLPQVANRSPKHYGAFLLDVSPFDSNELSGPYWTDRGTKGEVVLKRSCGNR